MFEFSTKLDSSLTETTYSKGNVQGNIIGVIANGIIVVAGDNGETVYVNANSVKEPINLQAVNPISIMKTGIINSNEGIPDRPLPAIIDVFESFTTINNAEGDKVAVISEINGFYNIIYKDPNNDDTFDAWVPKQYINL